MKMPPYSLQDIVTSYRWLGHNWYTELNAFHRDYQQGKENTEWNAKHDLFPKISYARHEGHVLQFVKKHHQYHMLCYGINPRPRILRNEAGSPRSAYESEIKLSKNLLLDFDLESKEPSEAQLDALNAFLKQTDEYLLDLRLKPPVKAFTGRGYHLLFAFTPIHVNDCSDIAARLKRFCEDFRDAYRHELADLSAKLDSTQDLRRMARIYGTAKPAVGIVSRFYGTERAEDQGLRAYLLDMDPLEAEHRNLGSFALHVASDLPRWFMELLRTDSRIGSLWSGTGKPGGDVSRSGYDYSLVLRLLHFGYKNLDELATIVALRPEGSVQKSGKSEAYVTRTIASALLHIAPRQADPAPSTVSEKV